MTRPDTWLPIPEDYEGIATVVGRWINHNPGEAVWVCECGVTVPWKPESDGVSFSAQHLHANP
jgi:hypothetical protein